MKRFNFKKTVLRNDFTTIFGGIGKRRTLQSYKLKKTTQISCYISAFKNRNTVQMQQHAPFGKSKRSRMQMIRRAHQGWRNMLLGRIHALKIGLQYGRRKPIPMFRR